MSAAALTVYDMCKSAQRDMVIEGIRLISKTGERGAITSGPERARRRRRSKPHEPSRPLGGLEQEAGEPKPACTTSSRVGAVPACAAPLPSRLPDPFSGIAPCVCVPCASCAPCGSAALCAHCPFFAGSPPFFGVEGNRRLSEKTPPRWERSQIVLPENPARTVPT